MPLNPPYHGNPVPEPAFHIALYQPLIPQNTGNIGRLAVGLDVPLHLIHPLGFQIDEKAVRRAGLDYWRDVTLVEHSSLEAFLEWVGDRKAYVLSKKATTSYVNAVYPRGSVLIFGQETTGVPDTLREKFTALSIPMPGSTRSLNLSNSVAIVAYQALLATSPLLFVEE
jgi:tRNA (cytidine/uridine-2'-O-)-methyltransferase